MMPKIKNQKSKVFQTTGQAPLEAARARSVPLSLTGQAVLLVVLVIGGVLLGTTTIAGFLTKIQLQQAGDVAASAKAIFAAETGVNCALYNYYHPTSTQCGVDVGSNTRRYDLTNRTSAVFTCSIDGSFSPTVPCNNRSSTLIFSKGTSGVVNRALLFTIVLTP